MFTWKMTITVVYVCILSLPLRFNGHFPAEPGLASVIEAKDDGIGGDNWSYKMGKAQSNHHHQQTNTQVLTGRMPFLSPTRQCQSTERKCVYTLL